MLTFLGVGIKGGKAAAVPLRMLSSPQTPLRNPNPRFSPAMASTPEKTLASSRLPNFTVSRPFPPHSPNLHGPATRNFCTLLKGASSRISSISIATAAETRDVGIEPEVDGGGEGSESGLVVVSFYRFADFPDHAAMRRPLKELCEQVVALSSHQKVSMEAYVEHGNQWRGCQNLFKLMSA